jgi:ribosomal subunit interface protein
MDIEIQTRHVDMQPEWLELIEARLAHLGTRYPRLIRVHVTLKHGRHQRGAEEVDIVAVHPRATLRAAKQEQDMRAALHAALDALERELVQHHESVAARRHRGQVPRARSRASAPRRRVAAS